MPVSVCPATVVAAPVEEVWALLMQPETYEQWWDIHMSCASAGQAGVQRST